MVRAHVKAQRARRPARVRRAGDGRAAGRAARAVAGHRCRGSDCITAMGSTTRAARARPGLGRRHRRAPARDPGDRPARPHQARRSATRGSRARLERRGGEPRGRGAAAIVAARAARDRSRGLGEPHAPRHRRRAGAATRASRSSRGHEVCERAAGLIALWGGEGSLLAGELEPSPRARRRPRATRSAIACTRCSRATAAPTTCRARRGCARARPPLGIPLVAANEVLYHSRARRPLQDVLTCIRHGVTLATAGRLIRGNDEHDLRAPHAFARLFADDPAAVARIARDRRALHVLARRAALSLPVRAPARRHHLGGVPAPARRATARRWRYGGDVPPNVRRQLDTELARDRGARLPRLLPDDVRDRRRTAGAATSCARAAARRPTRRCASASASPRSIRCAWACCSSASCRASAPSRPTSISTSSTSGARR